MDISHIFNALLCVEIYDTTACAHSVVMVVYAMWDIVFSITLQSYTIHTEKL